MNVEQHLKINKNNNNIYDSLMIDNNFISSIKDTISEAPVKATSKQEKNGASSIPADISTKNKKILESLSKEDRLKSFIKDNVDENLLPYNNAMEKNLTIPQSPELVEKLDNLVAAHQEINNSIGSKRSNP